MKLTVKNWKVFQHYMDRRPPWIKLHRTLLEDCDFMSLPDASMALAPCIWLLASEHEDGLIDMTMEQLAFRLHKPVATIEKGIKPLIDKGFLIDASKTLAGCLQGAISETEGERESETKREAEDAGKPSSTTTTDETFWPEITKLYSWVDVERERQKMRAWLMTPKGKGRKLTRRFVVNWLNKCDGKPLETEPNPFEGAI